MLPSRSWHDYKLASTKDDGCHVLHNAQTCKVHFEWVDLNVQSKIGESCESKYDCPLESYFTDFEWFIKSIK